MKDLGVSAMLMLEFTKDLSGIPARDFIGSLIASANPLHAFCVGQEWFFGKGGEGNAALLKLLGEELGFHVIQIDPVMAEGAPISSTRIRTSISVGNLTDAEACLGRPFLLTGKVISGAGLGAKIGFPTANLEVSGMQLPPNGVYAVKIFRGSDILKGVCNIGLRPTVDASPTTPIVEVHLFDCSADLVGEELSLEFVQFLRPERKFSGLEELKEKIAKDYEGARAILSSRA
jgi:riboflavin kinase/FMN adenylyltransferase